MKRKKNVFPLGKISKWFQEISLSVISFTNPVLSWECYKVLFILLLAESNTEGNPGTFMILHR